MAEFVKTCIEIQYTMYSYALIYITILTLLAYSTSDRKSVLAQDLIIYEYLFKSD